MRWKTPREEIFLNKLGIFYKRKMPYARDRQEIHCRFSKEL